MGKKALGATFPFLDLHQSAATLLQFISCLNKFRISFIVLNNLATRIFGAFQMQAKDYYNLTRSP